jgi:hypothetical protein
MKIIPREVRRRKPITWSREIRALQQRLSLTQIQKEVLIGTLLGDGCLLVNVYGKNYRLYIEHSVKQKNYLEWKYEIFREWCLSQPKYRKVNDSWRFRTISHPIFRWWRDIFYRGNRKIVPRNIEKLLDRPRSLAVWFMDDGALGPKKKGLTLNTQNFTKKEDEKLMKCLEKNFHLKVSLHKDKKSWRIYVLPKSVPEFRKRVEKLIFPEFMYKLSSL